MGTKLRLLWDNLIEDATVTASSEAADYPVEFTQNIWPTLAHLTTGVASEWWKWNVSPSIIPTYFAFWGHNFQDTATLYLEANNSDAWGAPPFREAAPYTAGATTLMHNVGSLGGVPGYDWWRFTAADAGNADGYLSAGYVYLGGHFEFDYDFYKKYPIFSDPSQKQYSDSGQMSACSKTKFRKFGYEFDAVSAADFSILWTIWQTIGQSRPFFIIENPDDLSSGVYYVEGISDWQFGPITHGVFNLKIEVQEMR